MKYDNVYCSQCGRGFGPGDHGFSHCEDHPGFVQEITIWQKQLIHIAERIRSHAEDIDSHYDDSITIATWLKTDVDNLRDMLKEMNPPRRRKSKE